MSRTIATDEKSSAVEDRFRDATKMIGNAAAMREALVSTRNQLHKVVNMASVGTEHWALAKLRTDTIFAFITKEMPSMIMNISSALSAPRRNCDVGTAEEQTKRFRRFCNNTKCQYCNITFNNGSCSFNWAQTPYEEGGAM